MVSAIKWREDGKLLLLDQRLLPETVEYKEYTDYIGASNAITDMVVRGAPAIGITGAYALALAVIEARDRFGEDSDSVKQFLEQASPVHIES
jgi:methylthioribose-1-phosphate isomerase